jgi:hypothetical protein
VFDTFRRASLTARRSRPTPCRQRESWAGRQRASAASSIMFCMSSGGAGSGGKPDKAGAAVVAVQGHFRPWNVRRGERPVLCGDPIGLDRAGSHLRQGGDRIDDGHVNVTCHQILYRRSGSPPPIRHKLKPRARFSLEEDADDMPRTAWIGG